MASRLAYPVPSYVGGKQAYKKHIQKRIDASPICKSNYESFTDNPFSLDLLPVRLDIENVSRCNLSCTMCQVSKWTNKQRARDMTLDEFKSLMDKCPTVVEVKVQGFGEPLLGESYFDMISYASNLGIWTRTTVNGTLLHVNDNITKLIDSPINEIGISIDGASASTYEKIRVGAKFNIFLSNLNKLGERADYLTIEKIKLNTVLQEDNYAERHEIIDVISAVGLKHLNYSFTVSEFGSKEWNSVNSLKSVVQSIDQKEIDNLIDYANQKGVALTFWIGTMKYKPNSPNCCPWPFSRAYLSSDMRIVPCCIIGNPDTFEFKSEKEPADFLEIWESKEYKQFRIDHLNGTFPEVCKYCYSY